ncbi:tetratricopeptide repeat protein [Chamaesiphon sp. GL140_3_metabinner_50]|uniref:tetratricopeptide repeat protein n=1 Tax=Chamaesiphon sp. GL140_3_metabinner_50 TaxID=2970812 RepID=UPI0025E5F21E|nr:tetratricopeptide repeat protein [Chamaesiphon sp. GL140_3_metabinner_50]
MSNPTTPEIQRVRFEEVTPTQEIVAFLDGHLKPLVAHLQLPLYDGYNDLDEIQFAFLTLPSGQTVTLGQYSHSPQVGVDLYVDPKLQDIPSVTFEACKYLEIPREEVIWFHPDWQEKIEGLYAEHGAIWQSKRYANAKQKELPQVEELTQNKQYEPIDCFNHALRIYTRKYVPATYWAMLQHNLGLAYQNRSKGDRKENLERSIECFNQSLEIYNQDEFPGKWQINQEDLEESLKSLESLKVYFNDGIISVNVI